LRVDVLTNLTHFYDTDKNKYLIGVCI